MHVERKLHKVLAGLILDNSHEKIYEFSNDKETQANP
jgi:hypothetical protein